MKILLVNKFLYPKGGDAISTLTTGQLLSSKGHQVVYWGMDHPQNPNYPHRDLFVDYVDLIDGGGFGRQLKTAINILYSFEARRKIQKLIEIERPDIVHLNNFAHQISPSILDVLDKFNIPAVMTLRDYKLVCPIYSMLNNGKPCEKCKNSQFYHCFTNKCTKNSYVKSLVNTIEMYLHHKILHIYDKIDTVIATSQFLREKHLEMGFNNKIVCLPNFIDIKKWTPFNCKNEKNIVYFGRLSPEKGLFTLLDAIRGLNIKLKIIGEGPIRQELENKVSKESVENVEFLGNKLGDELQNEISSSIASVLPAECYEAFGRTVIESFALGKPVIGARIGGIPELVIDGKTGYTFEPGNAIDLRAKIKSLLNSPEKCIQMGKNARKYVEEEFDSEKHYEKLISIYKSLVK